MAKDPYPSETADRFIVRFPDGMRDHIKRLAESNKRSMNSEIIDLLERALWMEDYDRINEGLDPFGTISEVDRDHLELRREDQKRRADEKAEALAAYGVDRAIAEIAARLERIENAIYLSKKEHDAESKTSERQGGATIQKDYRLHAPKKPFIGEP